MKIKDIMRLFREHGLRPHSQNLAEDLDIDGAPMTDNRILSQGDIFVCIKGGTADGHDYIANSLQRGASMIVCMDEPKADIPAIRVTDTRKAAALLAKKYFKDPASSFRLVGVTGTNGKTSTSLILFEALRKMNYNAGWIGTLGYKINDQSYQTAHTTPDILELNSIFAEMRNAQVTFVIMEVSSHAIALDRIYGIHFDYCLFTNLSRDHLDFHSSMEEYGKVKLSFFDQVFKGDAVAVINCYDAFGAEIARKLEGGMGAVFKLGDESAAYQIKDVQCDRMGTRFILNTKDGGFRLRSGLIGEFNANNIALAAATLHLMSFDARDISGAIASVQPIPGRMQSVPNDRHIGVFVDYAHSPDAIETVLKTCRQLPHKRILCLLGAGGDRDQGKRPLMLSAALRYADSVIVTDDNPRTENPDYIIMDIVSGSHPDLPWWIIRDRELAIHSIINLAQPDDLVVLCGKGHEDYQEIEGVRHHFDDVETAKIALAETKEWDEDALALPMDELMLRYLFDDINKIKPWGYKTPRSYSYISTDTRSIKPGSVFFALKGERFDAHAFLGKALDDESNFAIGEIALPDHHQFLRVKDSLKSMAKLHSKYLAMFDLCKLALTGSTGKTSTKEVIANICSQAAPTLKTKGNDNNIIGLCQTMRRVRPNHRFGIFELGTNHFGEIPAMADTLKPDAAMLINIGPSHLLALGSEKGVFTEKSSLLRRPLQIRLFDGDDPYCAEFLDTGKGVGYSEACHYRITELMPNETGMSFKIQGQSFYIRSKVPHHVTNAAFGIAFALESKIPIELIQQGLWQDASSPGRLQIQKLGQRLVIVDCYNANPVSMHKALEYWISLEPDSPHVAILGDMLELGDMATQYHQMIGAIVSEMTLDMLITIGDLSRHYHPHHASYPVFHFTSSQDAAVSFDAFGIPKDAVVLLKGSRGVTLEKLLPAFEKGD